MHRSFYEIPKAVNSRKCNDVMVENPVVVYAAPKFGKLCLT